jgi:hypothetical protein
MHDMHDSRWDDEKTVDLLLVREFLDLPASLGAADGTFKRFVIVVAFR